MSSNGYPGGFLSASGSPRSAVAARSKLSTRPGLFVLSEREGNGDLAIGLDARRPEDVVHMDAVNGTGFTG